MKEIWKFPLRDANTEINAPIVKFLTLQKQGDTVCVWAIVDTSMRASRYSVGFIGTGWMFDEIDYEKYIGTIQDGGFVWHYFWHQERSE